MHQHGFRRIGRGEWRPPARSCELLGRRDRAPQGIIDQQVQSFGEVENRLVGERIGAVEFAPGQEHPATRSGISAGRTEEKRIAQQSFVFAAAHHASAGGGGLQRQAAAPRAGPGGGGVDKGTQCRQRSAGRERSLGWIRLAACRDAPSPETGLAPAPVGTFQVLGFARESWFSLARRGAFARFFGPKRPRCRVKTMSDNVQLSDMPRTGPGKLFYITVFGRNCPLSAA